MASFAVEESCVINYPAASLTPKKGNDFPNASPNHDTSNREDIVIDAGDENPFEGFADRLNVLFFLDDVVIKCRTKVIKG